jgi:hypothetical protein
VISREDPRALPPPDFDCPLQSSRVSSRIGRSLARVFVSYSLLPPDPKHEQAWCRVRPAPAHVIGSLASGFVQMAWLPDPENTYGNALKGSASALGGYVAYSVFSEFQGDLWKFLGRLATRGKSNKLWSGDDIQTHK